MQRSRRLKLAQSIILRRGLPVATSLIASIPVAHAQQASTTAGGLEEIIVTAQKREESLQSVPISIQAIGQERLDQLQVKDFTDYVKFMPSVSFTSLGPGFSLPYFRGVASGENNNHSGPQPTVGMYLDEQPITTIQGSLDIHMYDIQRVEALAGPQGTLYGASSEAGTIRIITNKPDPTGFKAGYNLEVNTVDHGGVGYVAEGFVNIPISDVAAVRLVGWYDKDSGYIDNVAGTRTYHQDPETYPDGTTCISNSKSPPEGCISTPAHAKKDFNDVETYGARAALKVDLNDNWSITPSVIGQKATANGVFGYDPAVGDLKVSHYYPDFSTDKWWQAALTVEGKIGNFDLVYAGAYLKRDDVVDADYTDYTYFYDQCCGYGTYWTDSAGVPLDNPSQYIHGTDGYTKQSHEIRISSPKDNRFRFIAGLFYQEQHHEIFQRYKINGLGAYPDGEGGFLPITVAGWPDTIWLTNELRKDKDEAVFGELSFDFTDKLTGSAGLRWYKYDNSLRGFFGYGANYAFGSSYGEQFCFSDKQYNGSPCTNLDATVDDSGTVPRVNLTYKFDGDHLVYATYSEGFRPGGVNRNDGTIYQPDNLKNYEIGWKTMWLGNRLRFNGAVFREEWTDVQTSFLPPGGSGLTVIDNVGAARIDGIEADVTWAPVDGLTVSGGMSWLDAKLTKDYFTDPTEPAEAFKGDRLPVTPEFKGNLTARYEFTVGDFESHVQGAVVYNGDSYSDLTRADRAVTGIQPSYTIADFAAGFKRNSYTLELYLNNAFDERGRTTTGVGCTTSVCGGNPYYYPNKPRSIGLRFGQSF